MRLDFYILREWFTVFALAVGMLLGLLILSEVQNDLQDLIGQGATAGDVFYYYFLRVPGYLPEIIPLSLLLSVLFVLGQFHRNHEITAMRVAGLSLWRMFRGLWIVALILTGITFYLNAKWVPWSVVEAREFRQDFQFREALAKKESTEEIGLLRNLTFFNHEADRMWFLNRFNEYDYFAYGITVSELTPDGEELQRIVANRGYFDDTVGVWHFQEGRVVTFDQTTGDPVRSLPFDTLSRNEFDESPAIMKYLEKRPEDLALGELDQLLQKMEDSPDSRLHAYAYEYFSILFQPLSCLVMLGLGIPFSISGVRTNPVVGISKALGWFVLYYIALQTGGILGRSGVNPALAAISPNVAALCLALVFTVQASRPR